MIIVLDTYQDERNETDEFERRTVTKYSEISRNKFKVCYFLLSNSLKCVGLALLPNFDKKCLQFNFFYIHIFNVIF